jgi:putative SOS response-associated peptidase YedK
MFVDNVVGQQINQKVFVTLQTCKKSTQKFSTFFFIYIVSIRKVIIARALSSAISEFSQVQKLCYFYSIPDISILKKKFKARFDSDIPFPKIYSVSGFSKPELPVITNEHPNHIQLFKWGLIPSWVKDEETAKKIQTRTLNARAETIHEKASFRNIITKQRCLVLADGFFEWRHHKERTFPYYIRLKNHNPFAFAGLWNTWTVPSSKFTLKTYSIVTTKANPLLEIVHNKRKRMPVLLQSDDEKRWLNIDLDKEEVDSLLVSYDESQMEAYSVSRLIKSRNVSRNVPEVIKPMTYPELPTLPNL